MEPNVAKNFVTTEEALSPTGLVGLNEFHTRDFRLPPPCKGDLCYSEILRSVEW
jgi:hypothetical protein